VALPQSHEEAEPSFLHFAAPELPVEEGEGVVAKIIAGGFFGRRSPIPVLSDLFYVDVQLQRGAHLTVPAEYAEQAIYVVQGRLDLGNDGIFNAGQLLVLKQGKSVTLFAAGSEVRLMLLGGEPMDRPRTIVWNFVASSTERIEQAKQDWRAQKFPKIAGEVEFIPLPEIPGKPVFYP
jgi:redox-sensitive bicupin YhaK (pirin superfamily)